MTGKQENVTYEEVEGVPIVRYRWGDGLLVWQLDLDFPTHLPVTWSRETGLASENWSELLSNGVNVWMCGQTGLQSLGDNGITARATATVYWN